LNGRLNNQKKLTNDIQLDRNNHTPNNAEFFTLTLLTPHNNKKKEMTMKNIINIYNGGNLEQPIGVLDVEVALNSTYDIAYQSDRVLIGTQDSWAVTEYLQPTEVEGVLYDLVFLFDYQDMSDEDGDCLDEGFFPFDAAHCVRAIYIRDS